MAVTYILVIDEVEKFLERYQELELDLKPLGRTLEWTRCDACAGTGHTIDGEDCPECDGHGGFYE